MTHPSVTGQLSTSYYGPSPREVKLLDGVFLAAYAKTFHQSKIRFDPRFAFHFYDMDFSRMCAQAGLKLGTWPISIAHESTGGGYGGAEWRAGKLIYLDKWVE